LWSRTVGVTQLVKYAAVGKDTPPELGLSAIAVSCPALESFALGVGHPSCKILSSVGAPEAPLADVRCANACSCQITRDEGVVLAFHVILNKVDPRKIVCNLFTVDLDRTADTYEMEERWP
jgi:hypothetical protein